MERERSYILEENHRLWPDIWGVFAGKGKIVPVELIFFGLRFRKLPLLKNNHSAPNMFENINLKLHTVSVRLH